MRNENYAIPPTIKMALFEQKASKNALDDTTALACTIETAHNLKAHTVTIFIYVPLSQSNVICQCVSVYIFDTQKNCYMYTHRVRSRCTYFHSSSFST